MVRGKGRKGKKISSGPDSLSKVKPVILPLLGLDSNLDLVATLYLLSRVTGM